MGSPPAGFDGDAILGDDPFPKSVYIYFHSGWSNNQAVAQLEEWGSIYDAAEPTTGIEPEVILELIRNMQEVDIIEGTNNNSLLIFFTDHGTYAYRFEPDNPSTINNDLIRIFSWNFPVEPTEETPIEQRWNELTQLAFRNPKQAIALAVGLLKIAFPMSNANLARKLIRINPAFNSVTGISGQISIFSRPMSKAFKKRTVSRELAIDWIKNVQLLIPEKAESETIIYSAALAFI